jgi:hypothetical protein
MDKNKMPNITFTKKYLLILNNNKKKNAYFI